MTDKTEMTVERARALLDSATNGPWTTNRIDEEGGAILWQIQQDRHPFDVVGYTDTDLDNPRARHDGRLIAAAPDLARAYIAAEERAASLAADNERLRGLVREYAAVQREHGRQLRESRDGVESERHAGMYQDALRAGEALAERVRVLETSREDAVRRTLAAVVESFAELRDQAAGAGYRADRDALQFGLDLLVDMARRPSDLIEEYEDIFGGDWCGADTAPEVAP